MSEISTKIASLDEIIEREDVLKLLKLLKQRFLEYATCDRDDRIVFELDAARIVTALIAELLVKATIYAKQYSPEERLLYERALILVADLLLKLVYIKHRQVEHFLENVIERERGEVLDLLLETIKNMGGSSSKTKVKVESKDHAELIEKLLAQLLELVQTHKEDIVKQASERLAKMRNVCPTYGLKELPIKFFVIDENVVKASQQELPRLLQALLSLVLGGHVILVVLPRELASYLTSPHTSQLIDLIELRDNAAQYLRLSYKLTVALLTPLLMNVRDLREQTYELCKTLRELLGRYFVLPKQTYEVSVKVGHDLKIEVRNLTENRTIEQIALSNENPKYVISKIIVEKFLELAPCVKEIASNEIILEISAEGKISERLEETCQAKASETITKPEINLTDILKVPTNVRLSREGEYIVLSLTWRREKPRVRIEGGVKEITKKIFNVIKTYVTDRELRSELDKKEEDLLKRIENALKMLQL